MTSLTCFQSILLRREQSGSNNAFIVKASKFRFFDVARRTSDLRKNVSVHTSFFKKCLNFTLNNKEPLDELCCCINKTGLTSVAEKRGESSDVLWPQSQLEQTFWLSVSKKDKSSSERFSSTPNPPTPTTVVSYQNSHISWRTKS